MDGTIVDSRVKWVDYLELGSLSLLLASRALNQGSQPAHT